MNDWDRVKAVGFLKHGERSTLLSNAPRSCRDTENANREERDEKQGKGRKNGGILFAKDARKMVCFVAMRLGNRRRSNLGQCVREYERNVKLLLVQRILADNR